MNPNNIGLDFARTCNDNDPHMPKSRGDCFDFGQWYGCKIDCPSFLSGLCKIEDVDAFKEMIASAELSEDELCEISRMYPILFEPKEIK
jgi:hypothetical protein